MSGIFQRTTPCEQSPTSHHWAFDKIKINRAGIFFSYECQREEQSIEVKKDEAPTTKEVIAELEPLTTKKNIPKPAMPPRKKSIPQFITTTTRTFLESLATSESKRMAIFVERYRNQSEGMSLIKNVSIYLIVFLIVHKGNH